MAERGTFAVARRPGIPCSGASRSRSGRRDCGSWDRCKQGSSIAPRPARSVLPASGGVERPADAMQTGMALIGLNSVPAFARIAAGYGHHRAGQKPHRQGVAEHHAVGAQTDADLPSRPFRQLQPPPDGAAGSPLARRRSSGRQLRGTPPERALARSCFRSHRGSTARRSAR